MIVELVCGAEGGITVATVETSGKLDAVAIRSGLKVVDRRRAPVQASVLDGTQLKCARCMEVLYFRAADREAVVAFVGGVEVRA